MKYIIYGLVDPTTQQLRYIGKSCRGISRPKAHTAPSSLKYDTYKTRWIKSLICIGLKPSIAILHELDSSDLLYEAEKFWISYFKNLGCSLTNMTDGGIGTQGFRRRHTRETKLKCAITATDNKHALGQVHSVDSKNKDRLSQKRRQITDQHGNIYEGTRHAAQMLGVDREVIKRVLRGDRKSTRGCRLQYIYIS